MHIAIFLSLVLTKSLKTRHVKAQGRLFRTPGQYLAAIDHPPLPIMVSQMVVEVKEEGQALAVVANTSDEALVVEADLEIASGMSLLRGKRRCV